MILRLALVSFLAALLPSLADDTGPTRVACVGDSITAGFGIGNPDEDGYPAQLGRLLGAKWTVRNFGASRTTMSRKGDFPYWNNPQFTAAHVFAPQIVIIMLGTNDCIPVNQDKLKSDFVSDYKAFIKTFTDLDSHPKVWICTIAPVAPPDFANAHHLYIQSIAPDAVKNLGLPRIVQVAQDTLTPLIDVNAALQDHFDLYSDSVHPNSQGAKIIAQTVYAAIKDGGAIDKNAPPPPL